MSAVGMPAPASRPAISPRTSRQVRGIALVIPASPRAQLTPAFVGGELVDDLVEVAGQHAIEGVHREPDAMIGDAVLLVVVRADLLGAAAAFHLLAASGADFF